MDDVIFYGSGVWFAIIAANVVHWRFRRSERLFTLMNSKPMLVAFVVWMFATWILAILCWQKILPAEPFLFTLGGFLIASQLESIWVRHRWRKRLRDSGEAPSIIDVFASSPTAAFDRWSAERFVGKSTVRPHHGWSPMQSEEVRDILSHATPEELRQFQVEAMMQASTMGASFGEIIGLMLGFLLTFAFLLIGIMVPFWITLSLEIVGVGYLIWKQQPKMKAIRRKFAKLLCATEWARNQGYTPDTLRLQKWPWAK